MAERHDMVVIGAGWYGLSAARHYIELHPTEDVLVLEAESSCGGTWSENRLYPGLKSNNLQGSYEFPDFPMSQKTYDLPTDSHIPGQVLHRYLTDFSKRFGVFERTRFNTRVETLEPGPDGGWTLQTTTTTTSEKQTSTLSLHTKKVIVATGLTSNPNFPSYPGADSFGAPHFHARDFCRQGATVQSARNAVVVGGAKSALDVAYAYASAGAQVDLVMRTNGTGPVWLAPAYVMGGKKVEKLLHVRWMTWFSPCAWAGDDGWLGGWPRRLLHGTAVGRFLVRQFWGGLGGEVIQAHGYDGHPEVGKLKPWHGAFWIGSGLSIHNYDESLFEKVREGRIRVRVADVERLSDHAVHLSDGTVLSADVLVCSTGWRKEPSVRFLNFGAAGIGLPQAEGERRALAEEADREILAAYPSLRDQPKVNKTPAKAEPFRLYRFMVPPARMRDRNIAFAGMVSSVSTAITAAAQGLWISAFFDGRLDREAKDIDEVTKEVMLHTQFGKWRHPTGYGASLPDFAFDSLPYIDLIIRDLGLKVNRKAGWADMTEPYSPGDYATLVDEWRAVHKGKN